MTCYRRVVPKLLRVVGVACLVGAGTVAAAFEYYVDQGHPMASDANPGTEALPWATVGKAASTLVAGDTAFIKSGVYTEVVTVAHSGTAASPITLREYPGHTAVLDGTGNPGWYGVISLHGNDHVRLVDLEIRNNTTGWGVLVEHGEGDPGDAASFVELDGLEVHHTGGEAIQIRGNAHDVLVVGCVVHDAQSPSGIDIYQWGGGRPHHVTVRACTAFNYPGFAGIASEQADDLVIEDNHCYDSGLGIDIGSGDRNVIRRNTVHGCDTGIALSSNEDSLVHDNVVYDIFDEALYAYYWSLHDEAHARNRWFDNLVFDAGFGVFESDRKGSSGTPGPTSDHEYVNNVFWNVGTHGSYRTPLYFRGTTDLSFVHNTVVVNDDYDALELYDGASGADLRNNVIVVGGSGATVLVDGSSWAGTVVDYNCYHNRTGAGAGPGDHSVLGDPRFVDVAAGDLHLEATSPCVDTGDDAGVTTDHDGSPRPQGLGYDIGAYEYGSVVFADDFESASTGAWSVTVP